MKGTMSLLVAGLLAAGSAATLHAQQQQQQQPPPKPAQVQPAAKPATSTVAQTQPAHRTATMRPRGRRWTAEQIKEAQTGLASAKLYAGKISGVYDSATRTAVREFQRARNMPVTGNLSDSLLVLLREQKPKS